VQVYMPTSEKTEDEVEEMSFHERSEFMLMISVELVNMFLCCTSKCKRLRTYKD